LLEQYVVASSKIEPTHISRFLPSCPIGLAEEVLKGYQRLVPSAYHHQLAVVECLLSMCDRSVHPLKRVRAMVEMAKLSRLIGECDAEVLSIIYLKYSIFIPFATKTFNPFFASIFFTLIDPRGIAK
jgi:hypothetical protein